MIDRLEAALDRRMLLGMGAAAGLGAMLPRLARAAQQPELIPQVRAVVERWVGPGKFPGMVASLGLPGREPEYVARGSEGFNDADPVTADSLFRIYSMTKPITGMAAMELVAQGRIGLDQPVADVLPEYAHMMVQDEYDGSITTLHAAPRPITMRHLVTHSSGIGYTIIQQGLIKTLMEDKGLVAGQISRMKLPGLFRGEPVKGLDLFARGLAQVPLVADPGTRWSYSMGLDLMGRVIEVVSGRPFDAYLQDTIFGPAGMTSTGFRVSAADAHRLTTNYAAVGGVLAPIDEGETSIYLDKPAFPFGGAGLVSTPRDYDRFLRMLAQMGMIDGVRVLSESAVRMGTSNLLPPGVLVPEMFGGPSGFGAGGRVGHGAESGLYGWSGAAGTVGMVDMVRGLRSQIFVQFMPPNAFDLLPEFQKALKADVLAILEKH
ncbi:MULTISPECIES: serine hydrolase domain-containing protein [Novosphingobium]|jgi:CubicO group peptidase (beta-lactamase class C family)|uniref:serine hydrolase domain-containing protein n=1 Tax=Novosphingobium TaxID=165696 RepID=UPI0022F292A9|nr:serine hydrolase domain-containing protein [Novosphingobium resinovorum]GLK42268.1 serine hydrolase [Novosphingobium resinovorum]